MDTYPTLGILILLVLTSAFFSSCEMLVTCVNKIRLKNLAEQEHKNIDKSLKLIDNYEKTLSTILIGNNLVNIGFASLVAVYLTNIFKNNVASISTAISTIVILAFGEISPKIFVKKNSETIFIKFTPILYVLDIIFTPLTLFFSTLGKFISRFAKSEQDASMTEQELKYIVDEIEKEGVLNKQESDLIKSAIEFDDKTVEEVITHRVDMISISNNCTPEELRKLFSEYEFSRIPVYDGTIDNIIGVIYSKEFHNKYINNPNLNIKDLIKNILYVPNSMKISKLLSKFQKTKCHIAIVSDQYGGVMGLITLEDILEELVGEIWDETDEIIVPYTKIDDNTYIVSGDYPINDIFKLFNINHNYDEYRNMLLSGIFSEIPKEKDETTIENLHIIIDKVANNRVISATIKVSK